MKASAALLVLCVISGLVLLRAPAAVEAAGACNPSALMPCEPAITNSKLATKACCSSLMSQSSCFCKYLKDPSLSKYVNGGKKVATACGITLPNC